MRSCGNLGIGATGANRELEKEVCMSVPSPGVIGRFAVRPSRGTDFFRGSLIPTPRDRL